MKKACLFFLLIGSFLLTHAQWNTNTSENLKVAELVSSDIVTVATNDGRTYVVYYAPFEDDYFLRVQLLEDDGTKLFETDGIVLSKRKSGSATYLFSATVDEEDNLIVGFQYERGGFLRPLINGVTPKGKLLLGEFGLELGTGLSPSVAAIGNGDIAVAWDNSDTINYQKVNINGGGAAWAAPKAVIPSPDGVTRPQLVAHTNGTFGMVYQQKTSSFYSNLYEQRYDIDGNPVWAAPVQLSDYATAVFHSFSVLGIADDTYIGYYGNPTGQNRFDGSVQRVNADGSLPWGLNGSGFASYTGDFDPNFFDVNIAYETGTSQIWAVSTMSDASQINYGIAVQKFDIANGAKLLGDNGKTVFDINTNSERQVGALSLCPNGPIFTFYDISNKLYATGLDENGNFLWPGDKSEVGATTNAKGRYGFTPVKRNQAIAVWQETRDGADYPFAQNIYCDGTTGTVLPVTLTNLSGSLNNRIGTLFWQTKSENNNKGFHVQRSADGNNFSTVNYIATKATGGYSNASIDYAATDIKPSNGNNYYRIKQEDNDGKFTYSNVVLVKNTETFSMHMNNVYPNPSNGNLNIYIESTTTEKVSFVVTDATGKIVKQVNATLTNGNNNIHINIAALSAGNYFIKLISKNFYENAVQHFIKH